MERRYEIIDKIIAAEVYLYIIFTFITKGEGIRNVLLYSAFALWLATLKYRQNRVILRGPVPLLFWGFIATILTSVIFSLEPLYSLKSLQDDVLKAVVMFCLISTILADDQRLKVFTYVSLGLLLFTLWAGYYSYWAYDLALMKPVLSIRHAWHARFAMDINTLLPFSCIIFFIAKDTRTKAVLMITLVLSVLAIILSTSRGGIAAFITITAVWSIFFNRGRKVNIKVVLAGLIFLAALVGIVLYSVPDIKQRFSGQDISTLNERTDIWKPLIAAASERPVFGWGYGEDIFTMDKPFENTAYKKAPVHIKSAFRNPHNSFLKILFHQGATGVILYTVLLFTATITFWKGVKTAHDIRSYILWACACIMIGIYFVSSLTENPHLTNLALILGIGVAAGNSKSENSGN